MKCQYYPHIETSQLICKANQLTDFYMRTTLACNGLNSKIQFRGYEKLSNLRLSLKIHIIGVICTELFRRLTVVKHGENSLQGNRARDFC